jgi:hypothetical protein
MSQAGMFPWLWQRHCSLQGCFQMDVASRDMTTLAFTGGFIVARANTGPATGRKSPAWIGVFAAVVIAELGVDMSVFH